MSQHSLHQRIEKLIEIGISLSAEKDTKRLLEKILLSAKLITNADGGTIYTVQDDNTVRMEIMHTTSIKLSFGGSSDEPVPFNSIPLYDDHGKANNNMVVTFAVLNGTAVNIPDAYNSDIFDFSGTREFDKKTGYHSTSFLAVPMKNHEGDVIGVLQLLNAQSDELRKVVPFSQETQQLTEALASQAAIALSNRQLIDDLKELLESLIKLIATAIDAKSPHTAEHCKRVPLITMMLAEAVHENTLGPLSGFRMTDDDRYELQTAAWLHDCGKITTPEYVIDKATKLTTLTDRLPYIAARFEILKRDTKIVLLQNKIVGIKNGADFNDAQMDQDYHHTLQQLSDELQFLYRCNLGSEKMSSQDQQRVHQIGKRQYRDEHGNTCNLLSDEEVYNLTIVKGTLTKEERGIINKHITTTIDMLEKLPFPKLLKRVPEYAGGHHEHMDGSGYPKGLRKEQMPLQTRIMAIADVFEALTSSDRPYKAGKKLSETLNILARMSRDNHIDPDLFEIFIREKIYLKFAEQFLDSSLIDAIDEPELLSH